MKRFKYFGAHRIATIPKGRLQYTFKRRDRTLPVFAVFCLIASHLLNLQAQSVSVPPIDENAADQKYRAGLNLIKDGRLEEATETFKDALRFSPRNVVLLNAVGATYSLKQDFQEAQVYFLRSLEIDPGFLPARKNLAMSYFSSGKYDFAIPHFQKLMEGPAESRPVAMLFLGMIAEKQANYRRSIALLRQAGDIIYQYPSAILAFAHSLFALQNTTEAVAVLKRLDAISDASAAEYFNAGVLYSEHGDYERALADFDKARSMNPQPAGLGHQRAIVIDRLARSRPALKALAEPTNEDQDAKSLNLLAHVAEQNGDLNRAIALLRQGARIKPGWEDNYLDFSTICLDYENYALALEAADIGLEHIPNSYRLLVQKGAILEKLGRYKEAEDAVIRASQLSEDNGVALLSLGIIQLHASDLQGAVSTLSSAIHKYPSNGQLRYYLGLALVQMSESMQAGDTETEAEAAFRAAIRLNPSLADAYYQLGKLHLPRDPKFAERNLLACLRLDPHHASAEYSIGRLYLKTGRRTQGLLLLDRLKRQQAEEHNKDQKPRLVLAQK